MPSSECVAHAPKNLYLSSEHRLLELKANYVEILGLSLIGDTAICPVIMENELALTGISSAQISLLEKKQREC